jgi:tetratricopeptide (TPR) repeat protein
MLVAKQKLLIKEKRKMEHGVKTMTKEQILQLQEELEEDDDEEVTVVNPIALKKAEYYKEKGNSFFNMKDYHGALKMYKESLGLDDNNPTVLNNMAAVHLKLGNNLETIDCANKSLHFSNGTFAKAWYR